MKTISVLMSICGEPQHYIDKAIDSILIQSFRDFEYIIVIDNPSDSDTIEYIKKKCSHDLRVHISVNKKNIGLALSLNKAIEMAEGEYLARMDADDISKPDRLERELQYIKDQKLDGVSCTADKIDETGTVWGQIKPFSDNLHAIRELLPVQNVIVHPTVLMKADVIRHVGGYRNFASCQDYDLWLRLLTSGYRIGVLDQNLFQFRRHKDSVTATKRFNQVLNERYIRQLYFERCSKNNSDSFSQENLEQFLRTNGFYDAVIFNRENRKLVQYSSGIQAIKRHQFVSGIWNVCRSLNGRAVKDNIHTSIAARKIKNRYR